MAGLYSIVNKYIIFFPLLLIDTQTDSTTRLVEIALQ